MAAPKGNQFYKLAKNAGRPRTYDADSLDKKFNEYLKWWNENPFYEEQVFHNRGEIVRTEVKKMRPLLLTTFLVFADICPKTFLKYEKCENKDLIQVCTRIRKTIEAQQLEGASSGFLNPSIVARLNGLADTRKKKVKKKTKVKKNNTFKIEIIESKNEEE